MSIPPKYEREHWMKRFKEMLQARMDQLIADQDPGYLDEVREQAVRETETELGIRRQGEKIEELDRKIEELGDERKKLRLQQFRIVNDLPVDKPVECSNLDREIVVVVQGRAEHQRRKVMERTPLGQKILELREEMRRIEDNVMLATSSGQLKDFYRSVMSALEEDPDGLSKAAVDISGYRH